MRDLSYYNPDGSPLRLFQLEMLNSLVAFDEFCRVHHVEYSLAAGTLLGAVRHKGFIPWDDDMDINITRDEFAKLNSFSKNGLLTNELELVDHTFTPRIIYKKGQFLDLLILDSAPDNTLKYWTKYYVSLLFTLLIKSKERIINKDYKRPKFWFFLIPFAALFSMKSLQNAHSKTSQWFKDDNHSNIACFGDTPKDHGKRFPTYLFDKYTNIYFENKMVRCISDYDKYLKIHYGDYMKVPDDKNIEVHNRIK